MGEPLANYDNVMQAVRRIQSELGIGARHITISTVGLVPRIINLADENMQVKAMICFVGTRNNLELVVPLGWSSDFAASNDG